jgi:23S rRNA pseudouridine1911/1915/1917 synthase
MVVALTVSGQMSLTRQLQSRRMKRSYMGVVWGRLEPARALIDVPIGRDVASRTKMAAGNASIHPRDARTHYEVLQYLDRYTFVDVRLDTGRTHQIRVHMAYVGHPIVGDSVYGRQGPVPPLSRQFLHAFELKLESPASGLPMTFRSDLPSDLAGFLSAVRSQEQPVS